MEKRKQEINISEIQIEKSIILIASENDNLEEIRLKLSKLGYPEVGDKNTVFTLQNIL